jgi:histone H2A
VSRFARQMKKGNYANRVGVGASIYVAAVIEYLAAEVSGLVEICLWNSLKL